MDKQFNCDRWRLASLSLIFSIVMGLIIFNSPFWGLMDDSTNIFGEVGNFESVGPVRGMIQYALGDLPLGHFRPIYPLMVYLIYKPGMVWGSTVTFLLNAIFVVGILLFAANIFSRLLALSRTKLLLIFAAFPYTYDLFQHPSLQEKLVLLSGVALLAVAGSKLRFDIKFPLYCLSVLLASLTKSSATIYILLSVMVWVHVMVTSSDSLKKKLIKFILILIPVITCVGLLVYLAKHGTYTGTRSSLQMVIPNLKTKHGIMLLLLVVLGSAFLVRWSVIKNNLIQLLPLAGVSLYLVVMSQWFLGSYLLTMIVPPLCALVLQLGNIFFRRREVVFSVGLMLFALAMGIFRPYSMFTRLGDIREIVSNVGSYQLAGIEKLYMPCAEGSESMARYFERFGGVKMPVVHSVSKPEKVASYFVMSDSGMCPAPVELVAPNGCEVTYLYQSAFRGGYHLRKITCRKES